MDENLHRTIHCPRCMAMMDPQPAAGISVDRCRSCGGMWLDSLELEKVVAAKGTGRTIDLGTPHKDPESMSVLPLKCPRDRSPLIIMTGQDQSHIKYDACTVCGGAFFDAGELKDLSEVSLVERLRGIWKRKP